jgi:hypothetical protein
MHNVKKLYAGSVVLANVILFVYHLQEKLKSCQVVLEKIEHQYLCGC